MLAIIVHGGLEDTILPSDISLRRKSGVKEACELGYKKLVQTNSAIEAAETAVKYLEDHPDFDAGTGSFYNLCGDIEMDASIMTSEGNGAGIACIQRVQNPISVARKVMDTTPHVLIVGEGAELFARSHGFPEYDPSTEHSRKFLDEQIAKLPDELRSIMKKYQQIRSRHQSYSTVGAVAIDNTGLICAATSTGGIPQKLPGRVGDTPILGAGTFASPYAGASATGYGEGIIKLGVTRSICDTVSRGTTIALACQDIVAAGTKHEVIMGVIALDNQGRPAAKHNGNTMPVFFRSEEIPQAIAITK